MEKHIQVVFTGVTATRSEEIIALLQDTGVEGFEEQDGTLKAFWPQESFDVEVLRSTLPGVPFEITELEAVNWNEVWESNFSPVIIEDFAAVRAEFHPPIESATHEIVITPKMSFGTGHHATTSQMILAMRDIDFRGKQVFDFGTGTGVLAILAAKLGAARVLGLDNDDWSIENALENVARNAVTTVSIVKGDSASVDGKFDVILANINRHIIIDNLPAMKSRLRPGGILLLSGIMSQDEEMVLAACNREGLGLQSRTEMSNWLCLKVS